jgi:hypothetical protein
MEKSPLHFSLGNEGVGRSGGSCRYDRRGSGVEWLLTRTKDNARLPQVQREGHIRTTWGHVLSCGFAGGRKGVSNPGLN